MMTLDRRSFLKLLGAGAGAAGLPMIGHAGEIMAKSGKRVVVVGGGYGGTIAAKYIRMLDPAIEVVLIERNKQFVSCPYSNLVIGGLRQISDLTIGYDKLAANHGIKMVIDEVMAIDPAAKEVVTRGGSIKYDRLIVSPGVDFRFNEIEGYDPATTPQVMPHAWKAGEQTLLLKKQIESMPDGGKMLITMPLTPYRCPPGPYERACMVAMYLKKNKPKSKVILLDANPDVTSKGPLFKKAWQTYYKDIIEYVPAMKVTKVDPAGKAVFVEGIEEFKGDVVNVIPPQRAGAIAVSAGLVGPDKNWCPVDATTFESTLHKDVHVIGDAAIAGAMPKSGYSANSQAKACAMNVVALLNGKETTELSGINVCYSSITEDEAISVAGVYKVLEGKIVAVANSGGVSPIDFSVTKLEHIYADSWLKNILIEMSA
jgi:sulfide dehydrogenase [flavocytochrome c] flavoprotein subunit